VKTQLLRGPRFDATARARLQDLESTAAQGPSLQGWVLSFLGCAFLGLAVPFVDNIIRCTRLSLNLLPASSIVFTLGGILLFNLLLARWRSRLGLRRQDLALIFCTTMLVNPLPSLGFIGYLSSATMGPSYYARPENNWAQLILPHIPPALAARDPADPLSTDPRPVEWFFGGMPEGRSIPWTLLVAPYARWCLALTLVLGMFFAIGALLHRQWSQRERLPFPLVQVPEIMMTGLHRKETVPMFLANKFAWWGIAITFLLHLWNGAADFFPWVAPVPLRIWHIDWTYLTEPPWRHLHPVNFIIFPSVIGIMYLVSLEASFSLWFFFLVVMKLIVLLVVKGWGLGENCWYFYATEGTRSIFTGQGTGACFALVAAGLYMARRPLLDSLKQALGALPRESGEDEISPRAVWLLLAACFLGAVAWLVGYAGVAWYWAVPAVVILVASATGVTRLVSESGVFFLQMTASPAELMCAALSPVTLGPGNFIALSLWSRVFVFDWYRSCPMINILGGLHLGSRTGLTQRPQLLGMVGALLVVFSVGFFAFYHGAYSAAGGARPFGWPYDDFPRNQGQEWSAKVAAMNAWTEKRKSYAAEGVAVPDTEIPDVARTDWVRLGWMGCGASVLFLFLFLRSRIFWWPHPIGYVMWMGLWPLTVMWFSYFLGWACKLLLVRFGGQRQYLQWRPFFVGLIVGEALATLFWLTLKWWIGFQGGYNMEFN